MVFSCQCVDLQHNPLSVYMWLILKKGYSISYASSLGFFFLYDLEESVPLVFCSGVLFCVGRDLAGSVCKFIQSSFVFCYRVGNTCKFCSDV